MAIQDFSDPPENTQVPPDKIDSTVTTIISSLETDSKAFQQASAMYNSDFLKDESVEFKAALCNALKAHFKPFQNSYWNKLATS
jgi:hypothetical protein